MGSDVALAIGEPRNGGRDTGAYLALPDSEAGQAVLVLHAWWGLNDFVRRFCDRLAGEGWVALAPDFYCGRVATTVAEAEQLVGSVTDETGGPIVDAAVDALLRHHAVTSASVRVIGFSMGAYFALVTAAERPDDVAAVVVFYGTGLTDFSGARAAFLGHFAANDPYEPAEAVSDLEERLRASGAPVTFYTYPGTGHWFAEDDRPDAYDPAAADLAWERTVAFLREARIRE